MTGIKLYRSNSVEELADALADSIQSPLASPFEPEIILVQSLGMAKWVNLELAKRLGVFANSSMVFPNALINSLLSKVLPNIDEKIFLDREMLAWMILDRLLNSNRLKDKFNHLEEYCSGKDKSFDENERKFRAFQLARQLAMTYDQYLTYRPDYIQSWEKMESDYEFKRKIESEFQEKMKPEFEEKIKYDSKKYNWYWQAELWRSICKEKIDCGENIETEPQDVKEFTHKAAKYNKFLEVMKNQNIQINCLPERISVFGIPSLPPFHLNILASLSPMVDISFYVMTPAKGYFSDLRSAKQKMKIENREITDKDSGNNLRYSSELLHIETGNPLLASLGRAGADFMDALLDYDNLEDIDRQFIEPAGNTILEMVQKDILLMEERAAAQLTLKDIDKDRSIIINSCHSPMREVEVLNDYLLDLFNSNSDITPADVLVMTPDIESYAPFIRAVFTTPEEERLRIPFSIADLSIKSVSRAVDVFMNILSLPETRFEATYIMDILECDDVARCFNLEAADIDLIREWIKQTAIRWGEDGKYREKLGLPNFDQNSWRAGLDRLIAGYAMTGESEQFFTTNHNGENIDILPCDIVEGNSSSVLGSLARFFNILSITAEQMTVDKSLSEWSDFLMEAANNFFLPDQESSGMIQQIRNTINDLKQMEERTGFRSSVNSRIIKSWLDQEIGKEYHDSNFLNGGVTFCAMLPMRSVPAKVISILGLNDKTFPRIDNSPNFDLIKQRQRRGDRSLRNEDRYLFLETIISAKEKLYLSYTGQGIEDNSVIPPSVVISELIDYLDRAFVVQGSDLDRTQLSSYIVVQHPLQPFNPLYFQQAASSDSADCQQDSSKLLGNIPNSSVSSRLFSYSKDNLFAASALRSDKISLEPFVSDSVQPIEEQKDNRAYEQLNSDLISLNNLIAFFSAPQKYFLENSLGIYLKDQAETLDDCELFSLDSLDNYNLKDDMLKRKIKNSNIEIKPYKARGILPHGTAGRAFFQESSNMVNAFYGKIEPYITNGRSGSVEVDITYNDHGINNATSDESLNINGWRLKGIISDIWGDQLVRFRIASVKPKDILRAWLIHLAYACSCKCKIEKSQTLLIATDKSYIFTTPENPLSILDRLITIYKNGIKTPVKFFPASSMAYANSLFNQNNNKKKSNSPQSDLIPDEMKKANNEFLGNMNKQGECESEEVKLCFRHIERELILDKEFCLLSEDVFMPVFAHMEEIK